MGMGGYKIGKSQVRTIVVHPPPPLHHAPYSRTELSYLGHFLATNRRIFLRVVYPVLIGRCRVQGAGCRVQARNRLTACLAQKTSGTGNQWPAHNKKTAETVLGPERVDVQSAPPPPSRRGKTFCPPPPPPHFYMVETFCTPLQ